MAHILTNTIVLSNGVTVGAISPTTTSFQGETINRGFEMRVNGMPGYFTLTYTAELVDNNAGGVCNTCEITSQLTQGIYPIASIMPWYVGIFDQVYAQQTNATHASQRDYCIGFNDTAYCDTTINTCK
jgi:hypothetical protein